MIDDKKPYNTIGRTIAKTLPQNWEKVIFHAVVKEEEINWSMECFFEGKDGGILTRDLLNQNPELFVEKRKKITRPFRRNLILKG